MERKKPTTKRTRKTKITDHSKCRVSTDPNGNLTAGQGKQDEHGYWELPCNTCRLEAIDQEVWGDKEKIKWSEQQPNHRRGEEFLNTTPQERIRLKWRHRP